jgi:uncharacterized protein
MMMIYMTIFTAAAVLAFMTCFLGEGVCSPLTIETPKKDALIDATVSFVKETLFDAEGGHDWWHIYRVWNNAKRIAEDEEVDLLVVELGALLHDIADAKFHGGDDSVGPAKARLFLQQQGLDATKIDAVVNIVEHVSFKGGNAVTEYSSIELDVVQDADRLDALGAIGIARTFNYGGYVNNPLYDPAIPPRLGMTKEEYRNHKGTTLNHFYEKLLQLKDRMNTAAGRRIAEQRHQYIEGFLEQFLEEWG